MQNRRTILLLALSLLPQWPLAGAGAPPLEYQVKAVCVLNAARFVTWPEQAFPSRDAPLIVGILGDNPFGTLLLDAMKGETVRHRPIVVRSVTLEEAAACHILFISRSEQGKLEAVHHALGEASVLTISEIEGFASSGGMLGLALDQGRIHFELNTGAAQSAHLKVDSQFLSLCHIVK